MSLKPMNSLVPLKFPLPPITIPNIQGTNNTKLKSPNNASPNNITLATPQATKEPNKDLVDLETKLRLEFKTQLDQIRGLLGNGFNNININEPTTLCPSEVKWDPKVDRCRSPDGKFVKSDCCDPVTNPNKIKLNKLKNSKNNPPSYYILSLMNHHMGSYILSSQFHKEVNKLLVDNGIPHISPQQIRIFVNLNGFHIVKMNGQNTYKFLC